MMYDVEITNKKTCEVDVVTTDTFKRKYCIGRLGHKCEKELSEIGLPNGKRFKWFHSYEYSVVVYESETGRRVETLE